MFRQARSMGNTVIFLDEIDGMVRQRGQGDERVNRAFLDHLLDEIAKPHQTLWLLQQLIILIVSIMRY